MNISDPTLRDQVALAISRYVADRDNPASIRLANVNAVAADIIVMVVAHVEPQIRAAHFGLPAQEVVEGEVIP